MYLKVGSVGIPMLMSSRLSVLYPLLTTVSDIREIVAERAKKELSDEEAKCHQMFRLTSGTKDATYEWYKDRVDRRVEGTCEWFLDHENFKTWRDQDSGPLLVSADPGCGKSVLAKYLVDNVLPCEGTVCYFFFKDQDQNTVRQALCAVLHQLFKVKPSLIKYALEEYRKDGSGLINSTNSLWKILSNAIQDPQADRVIVVLDALDECAEDEFANLAENVQQHSNENYAVSGKLKYLLTSRPYHQIISRFNDLLKAVPEIHIPGEHALDAISQEVNRVVTHRVNLLSESKDLNYATRQTLEKKLHEVTHRTYLWVYLVFDYLQRQNFRTTPKGVNEAIAALPKGVNEAYTKILSRAQDHSMVRTALSIILVARRPLTLEELNVAVNLNENTQSFHDLDLEDQTNFEKRLRDSCGLFISVHHGKAYFLHQTAREFLSATVLSSESDSSGREWHHSIPTNRAHAMLAKSCLIYLNFFDSSARIMEEDEDKGPSTDHHLFLEYSALSWGPHFYEAGTVIEEKTISLAVTICDQGSKSHSTWFPIYRQSTSMRHTVNFSGVIVASYFGLERLAQRLLDQGADLDTKDQYYGQTPLSWAAERGHESIVKLLLATGEVDADSMDRYNQTPLSSAAENGHEGIVKLLLATGKVDVDLKDGWNRTPLSWAAEHGYEGIIKLLLATGKVDADFKDDSNRTPLILAAENGHEGIVKLLLATGKVDANFEDDFNRTPLILAAENGHEGIVKLLLATGKVDADSMDRYNQTPLSRAAENGHEGIVKLLHARMEAGSDTDINV